MAKNAQDGKGKAGGRAAAAAARRERLARALRDNLRRRKGRVPAARPAPADGADDGPDRA